MLGIYHVTSQFSRFTLLTQPLQVRY